MQESGFIKLHRQLLSWEWYSDINTTRLFIHILLKVGYAEQRYKGKIVERGARWTTLDELALETNLTKNEVRTALEHLKTTGEVETKGTRTGTLVKVLNYGIYQDIDNTKSHTDHTQTTHYSHTINTPIEKEIKNKRNIPPISPIEQTEEWKSYVEMRKKIKAPLTDRSKAIALTRLSGLAGEDIELQKKIIDQSIFFGWKSFYELKQDQDDKQTSGGKKWDYL